MKRRRSAVDRARYPRAQRLAALVLAWAVPVVLIADALVFWYSGGDRWPAGLALGALFVWRRFVRPGRRPRVVHSFVAADPSKVEVIIVAPANRREGTKVLEIEDAEMLHSEEAWMRLGVRRQAATMPVSGATD